MNASWIDKQNTLGALQKVGLRVNFFSGEKLRGGAKQAVRFPIDYFDLVHRVARSKPLDDSLALETKLDPSPVGLWWPGTEVEVNAWQKLAGVKFSSQGRIMLHRRALCKLLLWSKYRGNLMYMIYLTLLWLSFRITGHWNIPKQSTQDCYRAPRSAV